MRWVAAFGLLAVLVWFRRPKAKEWPTAWLYDGEWLPRPM